MIDVTSVTLDRTEITLAVSATERLTATVLPENASDPSLEWASSDESVASVDETGLVTAIAEGSAVITVTAGEMTDECTVTVSHEVAVVTLDASALSSYPAEAIPSVTELTVSGTLDDAAWQALTKFTNVQKLTIAESSGAVPEYLFYDEAEGVSILPSLKEFSAPEITEIGRYAFQKSAALTAIDLPKVARIGKRAFDNCVALTEISLPGLEYAGPYAFQNCDALVKADCPVLSQTDSSVFMDCGALVEVSMPELKEMGYATFYHCTALESISLPKLEKEHGFGFAICNLLKSADLPELKETGTSSFTDCPALTDLNAPKLTAIPDYMFNNCSSMTEFSFPYLDTMKASTFKNCTSLRTLKLGAEGEISFSGTDTSLCELWLNGNGVTFAGISPEAPENPQD